MKNKKSLLLVLSLFVSAYMFAAGPVYKIESVSGKVTYEAKPGKWTAVKPGQELSASTVINTGVNSTLVITTDNTSYTIKAMQVGTVQSLLPTAGGVATLKLQKKPVASNIAGAAEGGSKGTATASDRAAEAKEDIAWDDEDGE